MNNIHIVWLNASQSSQGVGINRSARGVKCKMV